MKAIQVAGALCLVAGLTVAGWQWQRAQRMAAENAQLRAELQELQTQMAAATESRDQKVEQEMERLRSDAREVQKLRGEVSQLRTSSKEAEKLRAENQRLKTALSSGPTAAPDDPAASVPQRTDLVPKEKWAFAGYATPDAALVSAISAMKEGNPRVYLDSLAPDEQQRMAKVWEGKTEQEIAAKHQSDVSVITGMQLLGRQEVSPNEVVMDVYLQGVNRYEKVKMSRVGNDWKFNGFIRSQK